jgi:hypothetical protein
LSVIEQEPRDEGGARRPALLLRSALPGVREGPKDCPGVLVHQLTKVHGDGENEDQKEQVNAKE